MAANVANTRTAGHRVLPPTTSNGQPCGGSSSSTTTSRRHDRKPGRSPAKQAAAPSTVSQSVSTESGKYSTGYRLPHVNAPDIITGAMTTSSIVGASSPGAATWRREAHAARPADRRATAAPINHHPDHPQRNPARAHQHESYPGREWEQRNQQPVQPPPLCAPRCYRDDVQSFLVEDERSRCSATGECQRGERRLAPATAMRLGRALVDDADASVRVSRLVLCQDRSMSSVAWCTHGIIQRDKFGRAQQGDLEICKGCGLPTPDSYNRAMAGRGPVRGPTAVERARNARQQGLKFFEIQLEAGSSIRDVSFASADSGDRTEADNGQTLHDIEAEGWLLHTAGYVFVPTGQSTRQKILGTGESIAISGVTVGVYLFRAAPRDS